MSAAGPNTAGTGPYYGTKNCQRWHDAMGPLSPYRHMNLGFSSWDPPHVEGALGHEEPCGGHCSILGSQPIDDQLGSVLVSAEEDLQGPKVSAGAGGFLGWEEPQNRAWGRGRLAQTFRQPWPQLLESHVQLRRDAQSRVVAAGGGK